jgi:hypothetical protein
MSALATAATTLAACSLLLDWTGYTGGDAGEAGVTVEAGEGGKDASAAGPACGPQTCSGCCEPDGCAGGLAADNCGIGGQACQSCGDQGLECQKGMCVSPPNDGGPNDGGSNDDGPTSTCNRIACKTLLTCLASIDIACCKPDGSCGCESILGPSDCR